VKDEEVLTAYPGKSYHNTEGPGGRTVCQCNTAHTRFLVRCGELTLPSIPTRQLQRGKDYRYLSCSLIAHRNDTLTKVGSLAMSCGLCSWFTPMALPTDMVWAKRTTRRRGKFYCSKGLIWERACLLRHCLVLKTLF